MPSAGGMNNTGVAAGLNKGHVVTRFTDADGSVKKNSQPKHRRSVRSSSARLRLLGRGGAGLFAGRGAARFPPGFWGWGIRDDERRSRPLLVKGNVSVWKTPRAC